MPARVLPADPTSLTEAVRILQNGGLVAFPTETVYGLGGLPSNRESLQAIFHTKGRPTTDPLILHLAEPDLEKAVAEGWVAGPLPEAALILAKTFWPGPLTLILPRGTKVQPEMTAGLPTVAVRCPSHPVARKLLRAVGQPLAAPSANRFGRISPTDAQAVLEELGGSIPLILDGGPSTIGLESTVVSLMAPYPEILRPGAITPAQISALLGTPAILRHGSNTHREAQAAPGQLASHYAPQTPLFLCRSVIQNLEADTAYILFREKSAHPNPNSFFLGAEKNLEVAARELYRTLRSADTLGRKRIFVDPVPDGPWADALRDRLTRASSGCAVWDGQNWKLIPRSIN